MRKLIISIVAICVCISLEANTLNVKSVDELTNDISARVSKLNSDGKKALVRIQTPFMEEIEIEGVDKSDIISRPGEYEFTVSPGIETLKFKIGKDYFNLTFADYGISVPEAKKTYKVQLSYPDDVAVGGGTAIITANYNDVVILIDGIPMGETPLKIDNLSEGSHTIAVPNINEITMRDTIVNISTGVTSEINLNLFKEKKKTVKVEYYAPVDGGGWIDFGVVTFEENGKTGIKEYTGEVLVPAQFSDVLTTDYDGYFMVAKADVDNELRWGLYESGKTLRMPCRFGNIIWDDKMKTSKGEQLYQVYHRGTDSKGWGLADINGNPVIPFEFENLTFGDDYVEGYKKVDRNEISYVYDYDGNLLSADLPFKGQIYGIGEEWGLPEKYFFLKNPTERKYYIVKYQNGKYISSSPLNDEYYIPSYVGDRIIANGHFLIQQSDKSGIMDVNGNILIPPVFNLDNRVTFYEVSDMIKDEIIVGTVDRIPFLMRHNGDIIIDGGKDNIRSIEIYNLGHLRRVNIKNDNGVKSEMLFDSKYNQLIPTDIYSNLIKVDGTQNFSFIGITIDGAAVTLNDNGMIVNKIPGADFSYIEPIIYNDKRVYIANHKNGPSQLLDNEFNVIFEAPEGFRISSGENGIFKILEDWGIEDATGSYGYVNMDGKVIANCIYGYKSNDDSLYYEDGNLNPVKEVVDIYPTSEGLAIISLGDRNGYIDANGKVVIPLNYSFLTPFSKGVAYGLDINGVWHKFYRNKL